MQTIVEPKDHIAKLWGKQKSCSDVFYRLMRYVLRVDYDGKVLLHNTVTGQLVVLDREESGILGQVPAIYNPVMEQLVAGHFLVPEGYDEHRQVVRLRTILQKLDVSQRYDGITTYTILPTTACNARCYYCFEKGIKAITMTEETADEVVTFITDHCGPEKKVFITWFGGEPTVAEKRIDRISQGLQSNHIVYKSSIVTNGYLFDEDMVARARFLWNVHFAQICTDGVENSYNDVKSYVGVKDNPYQRVMRNIQLLLDAGIRVSLRMNFDIGNYTDFEKLIAEVKVRFKDNKLLTVKAHPIIGEYADKTGTVLHGNDEWFEDKLSELNGISRYEGLLQDSVELPYLHYKWCEAASDYAVTITPEGSLVHCPEQLGEDQVFGNIRDGITDGSRTEAWKEIADFDECRKCVLFPRCLTVRNCATAGKCYMKKQDIRNVSELAISLASAGVKPIRPHTGREGHDFSGTQDGICTDRFDH